MSSVECLVVKGELGAFYRRLTTGLKGGCASLSVALSSIKGRGNQVCGGEALNASKTRLGLCARCSRGGRWLGLVANRERTMCQKAETSFPICWQQ